MTEKKRPLNASPVRWRIMKLQFGRLKTYRADWTGAHAQNARIMLLING